MNKPSHSSIRSFNRPASLVGQALRLPCGSAQRRQATRLPYRFALLTLLAGGVMLLGPTAQAQLTNAAFTPGNVVIYRVGDGAAVLSSASTPVFLDEYTTNGTYVNVIVLPTTQSGPDYPLTANGTSTAEGKMSRSTNARFLMLTGYGTNTAVAAVSSTSGSTVRRVVGVVDTNAAINTSTALTDFSSGSNPRSAASTDGSDIWVCGIASSAGNAGVRYTTYGATTSVQLTNQFTNVRTLRIFNNQLYVSAGASTLRLGTVGTGLPTTANQPIVNLPGYDTSGGSPYQFYFLAIDGSATPNVVYHADDSSTNSTPIGGIRKWSLVSGSWTFNGTITNATGTSPIQGLVARRQITGGGSTNVELWCVSSTTGGGNSLYYANDGTGYNATPTATLTSIATATANKAFRSVDWAPRDANDTSVGTEDDAAPVVTTDPESQTACTGDTVNFTSTASGGPAPTAQWQASHQGGAFTNIPGATSTTLSFTAALSQTNDEFRAIFNNTFGVATSMVATLTVQSSVLPSVEVNTSPGTLICFGTQVIFSATNILHGGASPTFAWYLNEDEDAWAEGSVATNSTLANGDMVFVRMTSNDPCRSTDTVDSDPVTMTVNATSVGGTATLASGTPACTTSNVTINLTGNTGSTIQWYRATVLGPTTNYVLQSDQTTTTYSAPAPAATTNADYFAVYYASVANGVCPAANSNTNRVDVLRNPNGGTALSGSTFICQNSAATYTAFAGTNISVTTTDVWSIAAIPADSAYFSGCGTLCDATNTISGSLSQTVDVVVSPDALSYVVYVQFTAVNGCSRTLSNLVTVHTPAIFSENFGTTATQGESIPPPTGWSTASIGSTSSNWINSTQSTSSGYPGASAGVNIQLNGTQTGSPTNDLFSPTINCAAATNVVLTFGARRTAAMTGAVAVDISTNNGTSFDAYSTNLTTTAVPGDSAWHLVTIDLPSAVNSQSEVQVRWRYDSATQGNFRIDDVRVTSSGNSSITALGSPAICFPNGSVTLTAPDGSAWVWKFKDEEEGEPVTITNGVQQIVATDVGFYFVEYTTSEGCDWTTAEFTVSVGGTTPDAGTADLTTTNTVCQGGVASFSATGFTEDSTLQWQFRTFTNAFANVSGATGDTLTTNVFASGDPGTNQFRVLVTKDNCSAVSSTASVYTLQRPINCTINPPSTTCQNSLLLFTVSGCSNFNPATYMWAIATNLPEGSVVTIPGDSTNAMVNVQTDSSATNFVLTLTVENFNGCARTITNNVTVYSVDTVAAALSENFGTTNSLPGGALPSGWTTTGGWITETSAASSGYTGASGNNNARIQQQSAGSLLSPTLDFSTLTAGVLTFGARRSSAAFSNDLNVAISTNGGASFDTVVTVSYTNLPSSGSWRQLSIDMGSLLNGRQVQLKWQLAGTLAGSTSNLRIDDAILNGNTGAPTITPQGTTTVCTGGSAVLQSSLANTYQWLKDGSSVSGATNRQYAATATGSYNVTVAYANGCPTNATAVAVTVDPTRQVPTISQANITTNITTNCAAVVSFTPTVTPTNVPPVVVCTPSSGSTFPIGVTTVDCSATSTNDCGVAETSFSVTVNYTARPSWSADSTNNVSATAPSGVCETIVTFTRTNVTDVCSSNGCPPISASCAPPSGTSFTTGTNVVTCTAVNGYGNSSNITFKVIVASTGTTNTPTTVAGSNSPLCPGNNLQLTATCPAGSSCPGTYSWTGPNSFTNTTQNPVVLNVTDANGGTYRVIRTVAGCGVSTQFVAVVVNATPTCSVSPSAPSICIGSNVTLTASGPSGASFVWSPSDGLDTDNGDTVVATPSQTTTYTVTVLKDDCVGTCSVTVNVEIPTPVLTRTDGTTPATKAFCQGTSKSYTATDGAGAAFTWSITSVPTDSSGLSTNAGATVTVNAGTNGTSFTLVTTATSTNTCTVSATNTVLLYGPTPSTVAALGPESFGAIGGNLPAGWTTPAQNSSGWLVESASPSSGYAGASGGANARADNAATAANQAIISTTIDFTGSTGGVLTFGARRSSTNFVNSLVVEVSTNGGATFDAYATTNLASSLPTDGTWIVVTNSLGSAINNQAAVKISWRIVGAAANTSNVRIDDVTLVDSLDATKLYETFGSGEATIALPTGWSNPNSTTSGWTNDTASPSTTYAGASGGVNIRADQSTPTNAVLISKTVSFSDLINGVLTYGARRSSGSFSNVIEIAVSTDGGANYTVVSNMPASELLSSWGVGSLKSISLGSLIDHASQVTLRWRLTQSLTGTSNTRMDDVTLNGTIQAEPQFINCPSDLFVKLVGDCGPTNVTYSDPSASSDCGAVPANLISCTPTSGASYALGSTTVTCSTSAGAGKVTTCTFKVRVHDITQTTAANITTNIAGCSTNISYTAPIASSTCSAILTNSCTPASGSVFLTGTNTVTCTGTDTNGTTSTTTFTILVKDTARPTIPFKSNIVVAATSCSPVQAIVTYTSPIPSDNCPSVAISCLPASGTLFGTNLTGLSTNKVICTAVDRSGNMTNSSFLVIVNPFIVKPPINTLRLIYTNDSTAIITTNIFSSPATNGLVQTLSANSGSCSGLVLYAVTSPTNGETVGCSAKIKTNFCIPALASITNGTRFPTGSTNITCTIIATNGPAGGQASTNKITFTLKIIETNRPSLTGLPRNTNVFVQANQCSNSNVVYAPVFAASDACGGTTGVKTQYCVPFAGKNKFFLGTSNVVCYAVDKSDNTNQYTFTVTVIDNLRPVLTNLPANVVTNANPANCPLPQQTVTYTSPTATDNCTVQSVSCSPASGSLFGTNVAGKIATNVVTCTAVDVSGNFTNKTFRVIVNPFITPVSIASLSVFTNGATTVVANPAATGLSFGTNVSGSCSAQVYYAISALTNDCGAKIKTNFCAPATGTRLPIGATNVVCQVIATNGPAGASASTNKVTFTLKINRNPLEEVIKIFSAPKNTNLVVDTGKCTKSNIVYSPVLNSSNITCFALSGIKTQYCDPPTGKNTFQIGTNSVNCYAFSKSPDNVAATTNFLVIVNAKLTNVVANQCVVQACGKTVTFTQPTVANSCAGVSVSCTPPSGGIFTNSTTIVPLASGGNGLTGQVTVVAVSCTAGNTATNFNINVQRLLVPTWYQTLTNDTSNPCRQPNTTPQLANAITAGSSILTNRVKLIDLEGVDRTVSVSNTVGLTIRLALRDQSSPSSSALVSNVVAIAQVGGNGTSGTPTVPSGGMVVTNVAGDVYFKFHAMTTNGWISGTSANTRFYSATVSSTNKAVCGVITNGVGDARLESN
jgi:hypothetical protein